MKYTYTNISSVSVIVFDIILFLEYLQGSLILYDMNEFVGDEYYSPLFGNVTCIQYNSTSDVCVLYLKRDHWFAILTLFFIYLPSVNVIATLYGPATAGGVGILMSLGMVVVGGVFALLGYFVSSQVSSITGWFVIILSSGFLGMGVMNVASSDVDTNAERSLLHLIMFIPLVSISPGPNRAT